jgi:hypothetical protein
VTTLHCHVTEVIDRARLTENSHSGVTSSNYDKVIPDNAWSAQIPWDDTNLPDTDFGLVPGTKVTLIFPTGSSGKSQTLTNTTVEAIRHLKDNANNIVMSFASGKGGDITREVT